MEAGKPPVNTGLARLLLDFSAMVDTGTSRTGKSLMKNSGSSFNHTVMLCAAGKAFLRPFSALIFLVASLSAHATFIATGSGVTIQSGSTGSSSWVAGETVTLSFSYELTSFSNDLFPANTDIGYYTALAPIALSATGSFSGEISEIGGIDRFLGQNLSNGTDVITISNRFGSGGASAFKKYDLTGTGLSLFPTEFEAFHNSIFPVINNEAVWQSDGSSIFSTAGDSLILIDFLWNIADTNAVPLPPPMLLIVTGLVGLVFRQHRSRRPIQRPACPRFDPA